jgi:hypothetical protein
MYTTYPYSLIQVIVELVFSISKCVQGVPVHHTASTERRQQQQQQQQLVQGSARSQSIVFFPPHHPYQPRSPSPSPPRHGSHQLPVTSSSPPVLLPALFLYSAVSLTLLISANTRVPSPRPEKTSQNSLPPRRLLFPLLLLLPPWPRTASTPLFPRSIHSKTGTQAISAGGRSDPTGSRSKRSGGYIKRLGSGFSEGDEEGGGARVER